MTPDYDTGGHPGAGPTIDLDMGSVMDSVAFLAQCPECGRLVDIMDSYAELPDRIVECECGFTTSVQGWGEYEA